MGMKRVGDSSLRVGTYHKAPDPVSITELRVGVTGALRRTSSSPLVPRRRINMVVPTTPIIPGDEDHRGSPKPALAQVADTLGGPLASQLDGLLPGIFPVGRMLGKLHWTARRVHPGHIRQFSRRHIRIESSPRQDVWATFQLFDFLEITEARVPVSSPCKLCLLQRLRHCLKVERLLGLVRTAFGRVIDYRGGCCDEHQMVGFGLAGHFREVIVAQRKLPREREICRNVVFTVLQFHRARRALQPCCVIVWRVAASGWILRQRKACTVYAGEGTEVIVEAVILLNDDHNMLNWIVRLHALLESTRLVPMESSILDVQASSNSL